MHHTHTTTATATAITAGVLLAFALSGCTPASSDPDAGADTAPSPTASASQPSATSSAPSASSPAATPGPTSTITPVPGVDDDHGTLPSTCAGLITAGKWQKSFAGWPLNDPGVVGDPAVTPTDDLTPVLQSGDDGLYCVWRYPEADITFLSIRVAKVDSATAYPHLKAALQGYDCSLDGYGYRCQKISQNTQYPVVDGDTYYTRGDVGIHIEQSNTATSGLLDDVIAHVF